MGGAILYYLLIKPLSLLPYWVLYRISDFFYLIIYHIVGYRKEVVFGNLRRSFPEKTETEITDIAKKFYRHFCDLVLESLKNFSISPEQAQKRVKARNPEVMNAYADKGQSVILSGGHYANWELWAVAEPQVLHHRLIGVYKKLSSPFFDRKMLESRSKFGLHMIPTFESAEYIHRNLDEVNAMVLASDQSPSNPKKCVWIEFLGQETGVLFGTEKFATEFNRPVVYCHLYKVKRGYYESEYEVLFENPAETAYLEVTKKVAEILEKDIRKAPEYWLWTHKRWKHKKPE